jgi:predicted acylesterase/phospholipase RssA
LSQNNEKDEFLEEVFPAELREINRRRNALNIAEIEDESPPSTSLGLVGLSLSGGGIRSATFNLGVLQALAKKGILKSVDYLSTVSGGGYIGSCLSSALNSENTRTEGEKFPFRHEPGQE